ncbi:MAG TPA: ATP-binding protein [Smithellaceae bacterium]|nr:ATP-binding protein [Smithellaceae bacterium]
MYDATTERRRNSDHDKSLDISLYKSIMETIDLGIVILGIKRRDLIFKNRFASEIFQHNPNLLEYRNLLSLLLTDYGSKPEEEIFGKTYTLRFKNRLLGYTPYMISESFIMIIIRDITERSRLESIAEAVNSMDNIGYVFSGIRHELGNPINSIKMTLSVLKRNLSEYSPAAVEKFVDRAMTEISRVEFLLQALKSFSIFENPEIQTVQIDDFLTRFIALISNDLQQSGIKIAKTVESNVKTVSADPRLLHQVMMNLITNASDALTGKENRKINIRALKHDGLIAIVVEDNGCGMSKEAQANLFKPFFTTKNRGTGLGLMITLKMVTLMKGNMEIKSIKDKGTRVAVILPLGAKPNAKS